MVRVHARRDRGLLTLAPGASLAIAPGVRVSLAPEASFLLRARVAEDLALVPQASPLQFAPLAGTVPALEGTTETDETARYHRWLMGFSTGLSWEHSLLGQTLRLGADYRVMLTEPARDAGAKQRMQSLRTRLAWLH